MNEGGRPHTQCGGVGSGHGWDGNTGRKVSWGQAVWNAVNAMLASTVGICQAWLAGGWITEVWKTRQCSCLECCPSLLSFNFSEYVGVGEGVEVGEGC